MYSINLHNEPLERKISLYTGIIPALVTPYSSDGNVDEEMLAQLVDYFVAQGVSGVYVCGSTGEGLLMTEEERQTVAEIVISQAAGRIPVIVHVGAPATFMAEKLASHAAHVGADAIASIPPVYYAVSRTEVASYYRKLKLASGLPLYFYNIPSLLNISLDTQLALSLFEDGTIQGMKYTHHDILTFRGIIETCQGKINVLSGPDEMLLTYLLMGSQGGIGTTYNCMPQLYVDLYQAWIDGNIELAQQLQYQANRIISILTAYSMIPAVKAVMKMKGFDCGDPRGPFSPLTETQTIKLKQKLDEVGFFDSHERTAR